MKKKRITYGVYGMMEYQTIIKIGRATLKVLFTDGSMTAIGQNPAKYTTSDFLVQRAIENSTAVQIHLWDSAEAPESPVEGGVYYLLQDCPGINADAVSGQMWQYKSTAWVEYAGDVIATE